jgi:hypothetical protein
VQSLASYLTPKQAQEEQPPGDLLDEDTPLSLRKAARARSSGGGEVADKQQASPDDLDTPLSKRKRSLQASAQEARDQSAEEGGGKEGGGEGEEDDDEDVVYVSPKKEKAEVIQISDSEPDESEEEDQDSADSEWEEPCSSSKVGLL